MLKLKVWDQLLCLLLVYAPNATSEYQTFVDEVNDALLQVSATESTVLMGDFNAHVGTDTDVEGCDRKTWSHRTECERKVFIAALLEQRSPHHEYLFPAQRGSQVYMVST